MEESLAECKVASKPVSSSALWSITARKDSLHLFTTLMEPCKNAVDISLLSLSRGNVIYKAAQHQTRSIPAAISHLAHSHFSTK